MYQNIWAINTQMTSERKLDREHSVINVLRQFLNDPIGVYGLIFDKMKFQMWEPV